MDPNKRNVFKNKLCHIVEEEKSRAFSFCDTSINNTTKSNGRKCNFLYSSKLLKTNKNFKILRVYITKNQITLNLITLIVTDI